MKNRKLTHSREDAKSLYFDKRDCSRRLLYALPEDITPPVIAKFESATREIGTRKWDRDAVPNSKTRMLFNRKIFQAYENTFLNC